MYQVGDRVLYGIHGVCVVADQEERIVDKKPVTYLVLEPVGKTASRFLVPMHNAAAMEKVRAILTAPELEELLCSENIRVDCWIPEENRRKQAYRELTANASRLALLQMIYSLYLHRKKQYAAGKKVHMCDENFLRDAEKLLTSEISVVMELSADQARNYLRSQLGYE